MNTKIIGIIIAMVVCMIFAGYANRPQPTAEQIRAKEEMKIERERLKFEQEKEMEAMRLERMRLMQEAQAAKPVEVQVAEVKASDMSVGEGIVTSVGIGAGAWLLGKMFSN